MIEVDGRSHPWREGLTLTELMAQVDPKGEIAVVRLNDTLVSRPNFRVTLVTDRAVIRLIPMVVGG